MASRKKSKKKSPKHKARFKLKTRQKSYVLLAFLIVSSLFLLAATSSIGA